MAFKIVGSRHEAEEATPAHAQASCKVKDDLQ